MRHKYRVIVIWLAFAAILISVTYILGWSRYLWVESAWEPFSIRLRKDECLSESNPSLKCSPEAIQPSVETSEQLSIPRILHQTWKDENIPDRWIKPHTMCRKMHPNWEIIGWTDKSTREFIAEKYPQFLHTYDSYPYPIERVDAARYFIMYHFGGVYLDLDIGCYKPMDPLLRYPAMLPKTEPIGFSNDFMAARPKHPFFKQLIDALPYWNHNYWFPYLTVFLSTGPLFVDIQFGLYNNSLIENNMVKSDVNTNDLISRSSDAVWVLEPLLYSKGRPNSFFAHFQGSSWHEPDAGFVFFLWGFLARLYWILPLSAILFYAFRRCYCRNRVATGYRRVD